MRGFRLASGAPRDHPGAFDGTVDEDDERHDEAWVRALIRGLLAAEPREREEHCFL
jgi:hypothetical protein